MLYMQRKDRIGGPGEKPLRMQAHRSGVPRTRDAHMDGTACEPLKPTQAHDLRCAEKWQGLRQSTLHTVYRRREGFRRPARN